MKRRMLQICLDMASSYLPKHIEPYCHYSFIIVQNKILGWGTNRRGPPLTFLGYPNYSKIHSEADAFFKTKGLIRDSNFDVVNVRLTKTGLIRSSQPCRCCYEFLMGLNCNQIWFTTDLGNFARLK